MSRRRKPWLWAKTGRRPNRRGWWVRWNEYLGGQRRCRAAQFSTARLAREFIAKVIRDAELRRVGRTPLMTMREAFVEFSQTCTALARDTQIQRAISCGLLARRWPRLTVDQFTGRHIDDFAAGRLLGSRPATIRKHLSGLHRFFGWCVARGYIAENPVDRITVALPAAAPRLRPPVTDTDLARLIDALDTPDRKLAVWLAMTTGLDRRRLTGLCPRDLDWADGGTIRLIRPKTHRVITIPIHPALIRPLRERCDRTAPEAPLLRGLARQDRHRDWWREARQKAGLPELWFRDLRAVAATRLQRQGGAALRDAQELLGHAQIETTARHYYVPSPSLREALERLSLPGFPGTPEKAPAGCGSAPQEGELQKTGSRSTREL